MISDEVALKRMHDESVRHEVWGRGGGVRIREASIKIPLIYGVSTEYRFLITYCTIRSIGRDYGRGPRIQRISYFTRTWPTIPSSLDPI